jgi:hypothetical protein
VGGRPRRVQVSRSSGHQEGEKYFLKKSWQSHFLCHTEMEFCQVCLFRSIFVTSSFTCLPNLPDWPASKFRKRTIMKNIFVGNLSFGTTEGTVRSIFENYGTVDRVSLVTDRDTGRARGFAFVEMNDDGQGERAISELNGRELDGRVLNVNEARPREERGGGGGGFRGRNSGGGRQHNRW